MISLRAVIGSIVDMSDRLSWICAWVISFCFWWLWDGSWAGCVFESLVRVGEVIDGPVQCFVGGKVGYEGPLLLLEPVSDLLDGVGWFFLPTAGSGFGDWRRGWWGFWVRISCFQFSRLQRTGNLRVRLSVVGTHGF